MESINIQTLTNIRAATILEFPPSHINVSFDCQINISPNVDISPNADLNLTFHWLPLKAMGGYSC